jgi:hypothetical protein
MPRDDCAPQTMKLDERDCEQRAIASPLMITSYNFAIADR